MHRSIIEEPLAERQTTRLTATIRDEDGNALPSGTLTTLVWTLYDRKSNAIINARDGVNGLPFVDGAGVLSLDLAPDDMPIMSTKAPKFEQHVLLVEWTWAAGSRSGAHEIHFTVANMAHVP